MKKKSSPQIIKHIRERVDTLNAQIRDYEERKDRLGDIPALYATIKELEDLLKWIHGKSEVIGLGV